MGSSSISALLVTANVGSIFEDPNQMFKIWTEEFLATVSRIGPKFIALHCQEVGGKNYDRSTTQVKMFIDMLQESEEMKFFFDKVQVFIDEDFTLAENFTALGNFYFIHKSIQDVEIYDFKEMKFVPVTGENIYLGNIEDVPVKEKAKFPKDFFPECKWSRKGFLRTRWSLNGTVFDLINIHLFHDASNFIAMEPYPSVYCQNRRQALEHTLQRFHNDANGKTPYFIFGDFNFRLDTEGVINKLTEGLVTTKLKTSKSDHTKILYSNDDQEIKLTVGKKEFNHWDHKNVFTAPSPTWLKNFDKELEAFEDYLTEYPITFPPSYPFEENISHAQCYMQTRCPAWCDRVLLSHTAKQLVDSEQKVEYGLMGLDKCMGDHKPVYLRINLTPHSGTLKCCNHAPFECLPTPCRCCQTYASVTINIVDMSDSTLNRSFPIIPSSVNSQLLTASDAPRDPYTPESTESRSPMPDDKPTNSNSNSVSAEQLKSRLEKLRLERKFPMTRSVSASVDVRDWFADEEGEGFRVRAMSEVPKERRMRLISTDSVGSIHRMQSHHSSSDEDWFEYEDDQSECKVFDEATNGKAPKGKTRSRLNCCCLM